MVGLNISNIQGSRQKLVNLIDKSVKGWPVGTPLPDVLLISEDQYTKLKVSKHFGDKREQLLYKAEDRTYATEWNVMDVRIVSPKTLAEV